ncbi:hypothetical protein TWF718_003454 [Orbilia javanica]|uniref:Transmembrane protein n=1 Tax=Orbilia javanica TaxID=47235 RepID=A0AAN8RBF3_9PEZI
MSRYIRRLQAWRAASLPSILPTHTGEVFIVGTDSSSLSSTTAPVRRTRSLPVYQEHRVTSDGYGVSTLAHEGTRNPDIESIIRTDVELPVEDTTESTLVETEEKSIDVVTPTTSRAPKYDGPAGEGPGDRPSPVPPETEGETSGAGATRNASAVIVPETDAGRRNWMIQITAWGHQLQWLALTHGLLGAFHLFHNIFRSEDPPRDEERAAGIVPPGRWRRPLYPSIKRPFFKSFNSMLARGLWFRTSLSSLRFWSLFNGYFGAILHQLSVSAVISGAVEVPSLNLRRSAILIAFTVAYLCSVCSCVSLGVEGYVYQNYEASMAGTTMVWMHKDRIPDARSLVGDPGVALPVAFICALLLGTLGTLIAMWCVGTRLQLERGAVWWFWPWPRNSLGLNEVRCQWSWISLFLAVVLGVGGIIGAVVMMGGIVGEAARKGINLGFDAKYHGALVR